jgi:phosphohistidine phosphatase
MYCLHHLSAEADRVMLFGHNPGLEVLAYQLAGEIFAEKFPTAAVAVLQFNIWNWADVAPGAGALLHFFTPRMLLNPA